MSGLRPALGWGTALTVYGLVLLLRTTGTIAGDAAAWPWAALAAGLALLVHPEARRRGSATWPVVLTVVGGLFAVRELGGLPIGIPLVPVLLVVIGIALLTSATTARRHGDVIEEAVSITADDATSARLVLAHGAGSLRLVDGAADGMVCEGTAYGGARAISHRLGERLEVTLRPPGDIEQLARFRRPLDWQLALPSRLPLDLEVRTGASEVRLDLARTSVRSVVVKAGASDLDVVVPAAGHSRVEVDAGAADVDVRVPPGVAASIRTRSALASVDVDAERFPKVGELHRSPDFDTAEHRTEIVLEGGVASFRVS